MFTVIIPTFNREGALSACIESVLAQTYPDFELIVVDNGSTDGTSVLVRNMAKNDARINYIYQENSGSPAGSRNKGIESATRDWIAFLDSDDKWTSRKLQSVKSAIEKSKCGNLIGVSHWESKYVGGIFSGILKHGSQSTENLYEELLFGGNLFSTSAMVVKKNALTRVGCFDARREYFAVEDYDLWMKLARIGDVESILEPHGEFHIGSDNMSSRIEMFHNNLRVLIRDHIHSLDLEGKKRNRLLEIHNARIDYYEGRTQQLDGNFTPARQMLLKSIRQDPIGAKKWIAFVGSCFHLKL